MSVLFGKTTIVDYGHMFADDTCQIISHGTSHRFGRLRILMAFSVAVVRVVDPANAVCGLKDAGSPIGVFIAHSLWEYNIVITDQ